MRHAGPGRPQTPRGRAAVVVVGVPLGLAGLALALTTMAGSASGGATAAESIASTSQSMSDTVAQPTPDANSSTNSDTSPGSAAGQTGMGESLAPDSVDGQEGFTPEQTPSSAASTTPAQSSTSSSGRSGPSDINRANPGLEQVWSIETDDPVFFITVDDNVRDRGVAEAGLEIIRANQIPITAFLTTNYVGEDTEYFDAVTAYGGSIQNHTVTHPFFNDPSSDPYFEVCTAQERLAAQFGDTPWMLRPPYGEPYFSGASPAALEDASINCGVNRIVMWSVVVDNGTVSYNPGPSLRPGDIVLFHFWDPKFAEGLQMILDIGAANGLTPAPLEDYL